jgi:hypothetical protein
MKKTTNSLLLLLIILAVLTSCKKEYDSPPVKPADGANKTNIASIKTKFKSGAVYRFQADSSLYCVVTADEVSGNLYKDIYVKDITGALHVKLISSGGLFIGDSIRINLKGALLNDYHDLIQLDSVDNENNIVKISSGARTAPFITSIADLTSNTVNLSTMQSKLIQLNNVEFLSSDQNKSFADPVGKQSIARTIKSCDGKTLIIRTSGYSNFAGMTVPGGNGSIVGIASVYNGSFQLVLRNINEVNMNDALCSSTPTTPPVSIILNKTFDDNSITSSGWSNINVTNSAVNWATSTYSSTPTAFAKVSGYVNNANTNSETWLISPAIDLSATNNPVLTFSTSAGKFAGPPLSVLVSTNYGSGAPGTATWTALSCVLSPTTTSYVWTSSGNVPLSAYKSAGLRLAFKYTSSSSGGATTYELDNILIKEN